MKNALIGILTLALGMFASASTAMAQGDAAKVYMTKDISPAGLKKAYEAMARPAAGKVAVKLSFGETGGHYYLAPDLIKELVRSVNGTLVDGNTAYGGTRSTVDEHLKTAANHGFADIVPIDILDAEGEAVLPITGGVHLKEVRVGSHFQNYDYMLVLTHFKGHMAAGFGGAIKNIAIGIASPAGKALIHTAGKSSTSIFGGPDTQEDFVESMAEAASGMIQAFGADKILYVNVLNNLSVDCDCDSNPAKPEIHDIGILSSLDPVALDKASVDLIYQSDEKSSASLRQRMEEKKGAQVLVHGEKMGIGRQAYELVSLD